MINWLKDIVIFFFWTYREFKELKNNYKACEDAKCTLDGAEKILNNEKGKENGK